MKEPNTPARHADRTRESERDRERERQRDRETDIERERERETERQRDRDRERERETQTDRKTATYKGVQAPADYPSSSWPLGLFYSTIALKNALHSP